MIINILKSINKLVIKVETVIVFISIAVIAFIIPISVFFRYVLRNSISWAIELPVFCFSWLVFVGAGVLLREDDHIKFNLINYDPFSNKLSIILEKIKAFTALFILLILIYNGFKYAYSVSSTLTTILNISHFYLYLSIPVGFTFMFIHVLNELLNKK
jgi:C4-dicarboxylate transporter, DctQ subunit